MEFYHRTAEHFNKESAVFDPTKDPSAEIPQIVRPEDAAIYAKLTQIRRPYHRALITFMIYALLIVDSIIRKFQRES